MNPFENIDPKDTLTENTKSIHYGRHELFFDQVFPFREPLYRQLILKLKHWHMIEPATAFYQRLSQSVQYLVKINKQKDVRKDYDFFPDADVFIQVYQASDKIWLALENVYFMFYQFAEWLEDCHFFIGDGYAYWLDEYRIEAGMLSFQRHHYDNETYYGLLDFYIARAHANPTDFAFVRFTLHQLYDEMTFRLCEYLKIGAASKEAHSLVATLAYNVQTIQNTTIDEDSKIYFNTFYSLDKSCSDWESINRKYALVKS